MLVPASAAAASFVQFDGLIIGDTCIYMMSTPDASIDLVWKSSNGTLKLHTTLVVNPQGGVNYCGPSGGPRVTSGDKLKVTLGSQTRTWTVPKLSVRLDRETDYIRGTGPVGATIKVSCPTGDTPVFEPCTWHKSVVVSGNGKWAIHKNGIGGASHVYARLGSFDSDWVSAIGTSSSIGVTLGRANFRGTAQPGTNVTVTVRDGNTNVVKATGTASAQQLFGDFEGLLKTSGGTNYHVVAGDRVISTVPGGTDWVVAAIDGVASGPTDMISGHCLASPPSITSVAVYRYHNNVRSGPAEWDTDSSGYFEFNYAENSASTNDQIKAGDQMAIQCMKGEGDYAQLIIIAGS
jgi:hypothetical protein